MKRPRPQKKETVNVLCQLYVKHYRVEALFVEFNISVKLKIDSFPDIMFM